jgi:hypothetical protein
MAEIVAACATIHSPGLTGWIDEEEPLKRDAIFSALDALKARLAAARPDVIIGIANDHMLTSPPHNMPDFAIGVAEEHTGPAPGVDAWLRLKPFTVPGSRPLARHIINTSAALGVNIACHEKVDFDDNFSVPLTYLTPAMDVPFIPMLINCFVPPQPTAERCYDAALAVKAAIESYAGNERVAIVATGGLSHEPGGPRNFDVDEKFDRWFLGMLGSTMPHAEILAACTIDRMDEAGICGTTELLAWLAAMAFTAGAAEVLAYEVTHVWRCGSGMLWWPQLAPRLVKREAVVA